MAPTAVSPAALRSRPRSSTIAPPRRGAGRTATTSHSSRTVSSAKTGRRNRNQKSRPSIAGPREKWVAVRPMSSPVVCAPLAIGRAKRVPAAYAGS